MATHKFEKVAKLDTGDKVSQAHDIRYSLANKDKDVMDADKNMLLK